MAATAVTHLSSKEMFSRANVLLVVCLLADLADRSRPRLRVFYRAGPSIGDKATRVASTHEPSTPLTNDLPFCTPWQCYIPLPGAL